MSPVLLAIMIFGCHPGKQKERGIHRGKGKIIGEVKFENLGPNVVYVVVDFDGPYRVGDNIFNKEKEVIDFLENQDETYFKDGILLYVNIKTLAEKMTRELVKFSVNRNVDYFETSGGPPTVSQSIFWIVRSTNSKYAEDDR